MTSFLLQRDMFFTKIKFEASPQKKSYTIQNYEYYKAIILNLLKRYIELLESNVKNDSIEGNMLKKLKNEICYTQQLNLGNEEIPGFKNLENY